MKMARRLEFCLLLSAAALAGAALPIASAQAGSIIIDEHGLRLTVPDRYALCTDPSPSPLDGASVPLAGRDCTHWQDGPFVAISGSYNAALWGITPYEVARGLCTEPHDRIYRQRVWIAGYPFYRCIRGPAAKDTIFTTLVADHGHFVPDWRIVTVWLHCPNGPCDKKAVAQVLKGITIHRGYWQGG